MKQKVVHKSSECDDDPMCETNVEEHAKEIEPLRCEVCDKSLSSKKKLKRHIEKMHEKPSSASHYECTDDPMCETNIEEHAKETKSLKCEVCGKSFSSKKKLKRHTDKVHEKSSSTSHIKSFKYNNDRTCETNVEEHSKEIESLRCKVCGKGFSSKKKLKKHIDKVHNKSSLTSHLKSLKCNVCDKCFSQKHNLKRHQDTVHKGIKPFSCDQCEKSFGQKSSLKRHIDSIHKLKHKCDECDSSFGSKRDRNIHIDAIHKKIKPFKCDECNSIFSMKGNLTKHIDDAKKTKAFRCEVHERSSSTNHKPFKCNVCDKCFSRKGNLKKHQDIVQKGIKAFSCDQCGKSFGEKLELKWHQDYVHKQLKPHKCGNCKSSFVSKGGLNHHIKVVHMNIKPFKCETCGYSCGQRSDLFRHQRSHKGTQFKYDTVSFRINSRGIC